MRPDFCFKIFCKLVGVHGDNLQTPSQRPPGGMYRTPFSELGILGWPSWSVDGPPVTLGGTAGAFNIAGATPPSEHAGHCSARQIVGSLTPYTSASSAIVSP